MGARKVVGAVGFEPTTSCSQSMCATRLRYAPKVVAGMPASADIIRARAREPAIELRRPTPDAGRELAG